MCANFECVKDPRTYADLFKVNPPAASASEVEGKSLAEGKPGVVLDVWPGYLSSFIRVPPETDAGDEAVPAREAMAGAFGLIPHWAKDASITRNTYNARSETVAEKPSFRDAWKKAQHCIVPAQAIYEPDWRSGRAVSTRIERADGRPMGIAGLWSWWRSPAGHPLFSFTMLTINADQHGFMRDFHKPDDEKRMVVILPEGSFQDWLDAPMEESRAFLNCFPPELLKATGTRASVRKSAPKPSPDGKTSGPADTNFSLF